MPDCDPLPEFCRYSLWKEYEGVAMHFNDLLMRLCSQSLAAVAAFAAIASAILRSSNESVPLWGAMTGVFGLLILFWIAIWVLDLAVSAAEGLGRNVRGGTRPRLSCGHRSTL